MVIWKPDMSPCRDAACRIVHLKCARPYRQVETEIAVCRRGSRAVPALRDSREIPPRFRTGHLVVALRSSPASKTNFGASDSIPFPPRFPRIRCARSAAGLRRRFGLMVKSLVAVEISHYTSDTGHPLYGLLVPYPRSGFTITAVNF